MRQKTAKAFANSGELGDQRVKGTGESENLGGLRRHSGPKGQSDETRKNMTLKSIGLRLRESGKKFVGEVVTPPEEQRYRHRLR